MGRVPKPASFPTPTNTKAAASALEYMGLAGGEPVCDLKLGPRVSSAVCTNARIEDLRAAAKAVNGHRSGRNSQRNGVFPAAGWLKQQAEKEGIDRILQRRRLWNGARPVCSMCLAMNPDKLAARRALVPRLPTRNFEGRQGRGGRTHLVSARDGCSCRVAPGISLTSATGSKSAMKAFTKHTGRVVAMDRANVDTDQIIPKQFLNASSEQVSASSCSGTGLVAKTAR